MGGGPALGIQRSAHLAPTLASHLILSCRHPWAVGPLPVGSLVGHPGLCISRACSLQAGRWWTSGGQVCQPEIRRWRLTALAMGPCLGWAQGRL